MSDTDTLTDPPVDDVAPDAPPADPPTQDAPKVEMTQADLDALIAKRLDRERKKWDQDAKTAADRAQLDEVDRLKAEKADAEAAVEAVRREALTARVEAAAEKAAVAAGVRPERVERFLRLVDLSDLDSLAADGRPDTAAVTAAITDALNAVPEFRGAPGAPPSAGEMADPSVKVWTRDEIAKMTPEEYEKHEKEILAQLQGGGIA